jgi:hypothetical protein
MSIFDIVPERFFSALASPNRKLYVDALCIVDEKLESRLKVSKDELCESIALSLANEIIFYQPEEGEEENIKEDINIRGKAGRIINVLKSFGWVDIEYDTVNYDEYITMPSYSQRFIRLIKEITEGNKEKSFTYVFDTYSNLKTADNEEDTSNGYNLYSALNSAYDNTIKLVDSFKHVYHDINAYYQRLIDTAEVNSVLKEHFDDYREGIVSRYIYPMHTQNSVVRYRREICAIMEKWQYDDNIVDTLIERESKNADIDKEAAKDIVYRKLMFINEVYNTAEENYVAIIEAKDREYTRTTTETLRYLTNSDKSIKGKLIDILNAMGRGEAYEKEDVVERYYQSYIDETSLYTERKKNERYSAEPKKRRGVKDLSNAATQKLNEYRNNAYSREKIYKYVEELLRDCDEAYLPAISTDEEYLKSVLTVAMASDRGAKYNVEFMHKTTEQGDYVVPVIKYRRRDKNAGKV